jgi:hypothetical protein
VVILYSTYGYLHTSVCHVIGFGVNGLFRKKVLATTKHYIRCTCLKLCKEIITVYTDIHIKQIQNEGFLNFIAGGT